jgi:hypothetical protein
MRKPIENACAHTPPGTEMVKPANLKGGVSVNQSGVALRAEANVRRAPVGPAIVEAVARSH